MTRDDFSETTKKQLAGRVGYACSFPGCHRTTIGPSTETLNSISNIGMACHIASASGGPGAKRYVAVMTSEERKSIENGIWMCYTHGKLIDTDEHRFTITALKKWKEFAEWKAQFELANGKDSISEDALLDFTLVENELLMNSLGQENDYIGNLLLDSCVPTIWGQEISHSIRDLLIEITRNAFIHGEAETLEIHVEPRVIKIIDKGKRFSIFSLIDHNNARGGSFALNFFLKNFGDQIILEQNFLDEANVIHLTLVRSSLDVEATTPCYLKLDRNTIYNPSDSNNHWKIEKSCETTYLILPRFVSISDVYSLKHYLDSFRIDVDLVFVMPQCSTGLNELVNQLFPNIKKIKLKSTH